MTFYLRILCPKCSSPIQTELVAERALENGVEEDRVDVCSNPDCDWKSDVYTTSWWWVYTDEETPPSESVWTAE